jgi:hypothetical protein
MLRTVHTRLSGGRVRWLALPLLVMGAVAVFGSATALASLAPGALTTHRQPTGQALKHFQATWAPAVAHPGLRPVGAPQAASPIRPDLQARDAKTLAQLRSAFPFLSGNH